MTIGPRICHLCFADTWNVAGVKNKRNLVYFFQEICGTLMRNLVYFFKIFVGEFVGAWPHSRWWHWCGDFCCWSCTPWHTWDDRRGEQHFRRLNIRFVLIGIVIGWSVREFVGDEKFSILFSRDLWDSLWDSLWESLCMGICGRPSTNYLPQIPGRAFVGELAGGKHDNLTVMSEPSKICQAIAHFRTVGRTPNQHFSWTLLRVKCVVTDTLMTD